MRTGWFLLFFFFSGLCSLVYEVVWLRLAMAAFGVTAPTISIVLSVFMGGLALGSWMAGQLSSRLDDVSGRVALRLYGCAELLIGLSAVIVPYLLKSGQAMLATSGKNIEWASSTYHIAAGICIALALLPFCIAMGATFPLAIASIQRSVGAGSERSFSYLYVANVLGAGIGTIASALVLIELFGFRGTLFVGAIINVLVAAAAVALSFRVRSVGGARVPAKKTVKRRDGVASGGKITPALLFLTGLTSMALEVIWVRQFTPFLGTVVYAFATILAVYLIATFVGSVIYRRWASLGFPIRGPWLGAIWFSTGCLALLSLIGADPRLGIGPMPVISGIAVGRVTIGIAPFCIAVGFLTPALVDHWSSGNPGRAGSAYSLNVMGCIIGPLVASFFVLPWVGERKGLVGLSAVLLVVGVLTVYLDAQKNSPREFGRRGPIVVMSVFGAAFALILALTRDFESTFPNPIVRRDATATVIAAGEGRKKQLFVNGSGMSALITITKTIAHLPLAFCNQPPRSALVICFGMGTSFRSATTWGIPVTAVELVPAVPALFGFYHADAAEVLQRPGARIVIDDGRRFLERTKEIYDVITVDPPPPTEAAGTSLLYSREFYAAARPHLRPGGILQQWLPQTLEPALVSTVARSLKDSFPYVRAFGSSSLWGLHLLASDQPIPHITADDLAARMPAAAARDIVEWELGYIPAGIFSVILQQEVPIERLIALDPKVPALTDDQPVNEYYFLRRGRSFRLMVPEVANQIQPDKQRYN